MSTPGPGVSGVAPWVALGCGLALAACGAGALPATRAGGASALDRSLRSVDYRVRVAADLSRMDVRVCFDGASPRALRSTSGEGWSDVMEAFLAGPEPRALPHGQRGIELDGIPDAACVDYAVDLHATERAGWVASDTTGARLLEVNRWLLRPSGILSGLDLRLRFELPRGMAHSVPWPRDGDAYRLTSSVFTFRGYSAFGRLDLEHIDVPGGRLNVAILPGLPPETRAAVRPWLQAQGQAAALSGAGLASPRLQVLVVPSGPAAEPVRFGVTMRGGGPSVLLFLPRNAKAPQLRTDWVAVHEFSHLRLPFLDRRDAWLSEGLATYFQEVLRVRAGLRPAALAWARFFEGASHRELAEHSLAQESEAMFAKLSFPLVYWGGAAFVLLADAELRARSGGRQSLDTVLTQLTACCAVSDRPWRAEELVAELDRLSGQSVFTELYRRHVTGTDFPDLHRLFERLGLRVDGGHVTLAPDAELGWVRDAIMAAPAR